MSDSLQLFEFSGTQRTPPGSSVHGISQAGVSCHFLLQGIFLIQGSNPHLLHLLCWQADSLPLSHLGILSDTSTSLKFKFYKTVKCAYPSLFPFPKSAVTSEAICDIGVCLPCFLFFSLLNQEYHVKHKVLYLFFFTPQCILIIVPYQYI